MHQPAASPRCRQGDGRRRPDSSLGLPAARRVFQPRSAGALGHGPAPSLPRRAAHVPALRRYRRGALFPVPPRSPRAPARAGPAARFSRSAARLCLRSRPERFLPAALHASEQ